MDRPLSKPVVVVVGEGGKILLPPDVLDHLGMPRGGTVMARKGPGNVVVLGPKLRPAR